MNNMISLSSEVNEALAANRPVIALESTIISHGMPYPQNIEVACNLENMAREMGVTPATICLMDGKIQVGINQEKLEMLAQSKNCLKVSRRNFSKALIDKRIGATTVSATMMAASMAGIKVFATGGIGGVHRGAEESMDISADLPEFQKSPVIVVCAGAKAILDLPKTLEYLETAGIPLYGYKTESFPAFYSAKSKYKVCSIESVEKIVEHYKMDRLLGLTSGILIANPIPQQYEIPFDKMEEHIQSAVCDITAQGITGAEVTPYLLAKIVEITNGKSLQTNIKLVENNVKLACNIAKKF